MHPATTHRPRRKLASEINVVPYIDVMLVLLIIFMITAPLLTKGVQVDLPQGAAEVIEFTDDNEPLVLSVDRNGLLYLNFGDGQSEPKSDGEIIKRAQVVLKRAPNTPVVVEGDAQVPYEKVIQGMLLLQQAGAKKVGFATDPAEFIGAGNEARR